VVVSHDRSQLPAAYQAAILRVLDKAHSSGHAVLLLVLPTGETISAFGTVSSESLQKLLPRQPCAPELKTIDLAVLSAKWAKVSATVQRAWCFEIFQIGKQHWSAEMVKQSAIKWQGRVCFVQKVLVLTYFGRQAGSAAVEHVLLLRQDGRANRIGQVARVCELSRGCLLLVPCQKADWKEVRSPVVQTYRSSVWF